MFKKIKNAYVVIFWVSPTFLMSLTSCSIVLGVLFIFLIRTSYKDNHILSIWLRIWSWSPSIQNNIFFKWISVEVSKTLYLLLENTSCLEKKYTALLNCWFSWKRMKKYMIKNEKLKLRIWEIPIPWSGELHCMVNGVVVSD